MKPTIIFTTLFILEILIGKYFDIVAGILLAGITFLAGVCVIAFKCRELEKCGFGKFH